MATYTPTVINITLNGLQMDTIAQASATSYNAFGFTELDTNWSDFNKLLVHLEDRVITAKSDGELLAVSIVNGEYLPSAVVDGFKAIAAKYKKNITFTVSLLLNVDAMTPTTVTY